MRIGLLVIAGLALIGFVVVAFVLPRQASTETNEAAQALVAGVAAAQQQVAAAALRAGALGGAGRGVKLLARSDARHGDLKWIVSENGDIRGWNANRKNPIEIVLKPSLQDGKVSWACRGFPLDAMPAGCGRN